MKHILIVLTLLFFLTGCQPSSEKEFDATSAVDSLFDAYHLFKLQTNPVEATKAGEFQYNDTIANYISEDYRLLLVDRFDRFLYAIDQLEKDKLSQEDQLSLRVMQWDCEVKREGLTNELVTVASPVYDLPHFQLMPFGQTSAFPLYISQLASGISLQPFENVQDYENWLLRVEDYLTWLETAIVNMKTGMEQGVVMPRVLIQKIIGQLSSFAEGPATAHLFYQPIGLMPESISGDDRERLTIAYTQMIRNRVIPIYRELVDFLKNEYLPAGRDSHGISALTNGPETYEYLIKYHTTTNMTPDEIFNLGMKEVERIKSEMESVKEQVGFTGDLKSFFDHVRFRKDLMPFDEPQQVLDNFNAIHEKMKANIPRLFNIAPKAGFNVRRTEAFREQSASAEYVPGSKDGSRPGVFYVPIRDVKSYNVFADEALFLHEAIPGHHYQLSLQQENQVLPAFLHPESIGVFVEGWALYAESLGKELGLYEDPYQYFGMLSMEMHRAIRLVVDAGIHAKGWTREQAIRFSLENEAEPEASIIAEIERYMVMPGQALSYKIGQLKIRELRNRAEEALGDKFDIRKFHNQVLNSGSLPLVLLEEKIEGWIRDTSDL